MHKLALVHCGGPIASVPTHITWSICPASHLLHLLNYEALGSYSFSHWEHAKGEIYRRTLTLIKADTECAVRVDELVWPSRGSWNLGSVWYITVDPEMVSSIFTSVLHFSTGLLYMYPYTVYHRDWDIFYMKCAIFIHNSNKQWKA